jgi:hypothetical protein
MQEHIYTQREPLVGANESQTRHIEGDDMVVFDAMAMMLAASRSTCSAICLLAIVAVPSRINEANGRPAPSSPPDPAAAAANVHADEICATSSPPESGPLAIVNCTSWALGDLPSGPPSKPSQIL